MLYPYKLQQIFKEQVCILYQTRWSGNYTVVLKQQTKNPRRFLCLGSCVWSLFKTLVLVLSLYTKPGRRP